MQNIICRNCKETFRGRRTSYGERKYCSRECWGESHRGKNAPAWQGGKIKDVAGYIRVYKPSHPYCFSGGYVLEHRLIMEKHIGRLLKKNEIVHHINGNKSDNRIENLFVTTRKRHLLEHHPDLLKKSIKKALKQRWVGHKNFSAEERRIRHNTVVRKYYAKRRNS